MLAVATHALWTRARANRLDLAVLRAVGCTRRRLDAVSAWQALPAVVAALAIGVPVGIALGRWTFIVFARSLAVVDQARTTPVAVGALVVAVLVALAIADVGLVAVRRTSSSIGVGDR
jgi:putative ABC transport system permease protein